MGGNVTVIGAGIIGLSIAVELQERGFSVRILEKKSVAGEASGGLAGAYAFSDVIPIATPGLLRKVPKWLLDPLGPLSIHPAYLLRVAPWLFKFWRASQPKRFEASVQAQAQLMALSQAALERQITLVAGESLMRREGQMQLYEGARAFEASLSGWQLRKKQGIAFRVLEKQGEIEKLQPGLHPGFTHAVFTPEWINVVDPKIWADHLAAHFKARGGGLDFANVQSLSEGQKRIVIHCENGKTREAERVVVACGAWSHQLSGSFGEKIPLETERGYNTTLPNCPFPLKLHLSFADHGFVVSKAGNGIRVGGAVEFAGLKRAPNFRRSEILLEKAARFLPGLDILSDASERKHQWMGFRPSTPDSLPILGPSRKSPRLFYAFGHGHLGLTQSAGTAEVISDLLEQRRPEISLHAFAAGRFLT